MLKMSASSPGAPYGERDSEMLPTSEAFHNNPEPDTVTPSGDPRPPIPERPPRANISSSESNGKPVLMLPERTVLVAPDIARTGTEALETVTSPAPAPSREYGLDVSLPTVPIGPDVSSPAVQVGPDIPSPAVPNGPDYPAPPSLGVPDDNTDTLPAGMRTPRPGYLTPNSHVAFSFSRENLSIQGDKAETVVSFVIRNPTLVGEGDVQVEECEQNGYIWTMLLSTLYAVVLILAGIAIPLAEALHHQWLSSHEVGIFLAYLFLLSSLFLGYLQVTLFWERRKEQRSRSIESSTASLPPMSPHVEKPYSPDPRTRDERAMNGIPSDMLLLRLRKLEPNLRSDASVTNSSGQYSLPNGGHKGPDLDRSFSYPPSPAPSTLPRQRRRHELPKLAIEGVTAQNSEEMTPPGSMAGQYLSPPMRDMDSVSLQASEYGDLYEEEVYEQFLLLQQTASLTHEGASFYLRLGCLLFGVGNLVFVSLEIYTSTYSDPRCHSSNLLYPRWCQLIFILVQTFFLFKHTTIHVKRRKGIVRFGLLHVLATNLCIWLRVLTQEVVEAFKTQMHYEEDSYNSTHNVSCEASDLLHDLSPYLSPFVLEYSLIAVATMAGMFQGLNLRINTDLLSSLKKAIQHSLKADNRRRSTAQQQESVFAKSHKGLYLGVLLLAGTIVSIILFFFNLGSQELYSDAVIIFYVSDICIHSALVIAVGIAIAQLRALKVTFNRDNTIDDVLLMVSLSGLILLHIFVLIASTTTLADDEEEQLTSSTTISLAVAVCVINIVQGLMQTAFVMDGLQRCAKDTEQQREKPGRGVTTFLIISNVALWIFKTFQVKELGLTNIETFFGPIAWPVILNVCLPLLLFYRFHSSVCLADIWVSAYHLETGPKYTAL